MSCTPLPKAAKADWVKQLFLLPCLVVYVGGFDLRCDMGTSTENLDLGIKFVNSWEIGTVTSLRDVGVLGTGHSSRMSERSRPQHNSLLLGTSEQQNLAQQQAALAYEKAHRVPNEPSAQSTA